MLDYQLSGVAEHAEQLRALAKAQGLRPPESVISPPAPKPEEAFYWRAFMDLQTTRQAAGMAISWHHMAAYADRYGVRDLEHFVMIVRKLDNHLLTECADNG